MAVCSTTALRKYLTQRSNLGQPLREKAVSTTRGHAEGETLITSGAYRRPLFKSSLGSCDADGRRASQLQHAGQDLAGHLHLGRPTLVRTRAQPVPDHALEPADGGLGPGPF